MKQQTHQLTAKDYIRSENFRGHKCKNCSHLFSRSSDIYVGYTKENHRVTRCEQCQRYNMIKVGETEPHLVTRRQEKTLSMKVPLSESNVKTILTGLFIALVVGFVLMGMFVFN